MSKLPCIGPEFIKSPIAEAYRKLRTSIQFSDLENGSQAVLFTSAGPGEGKSTTVANTAMVLAHSGKRVLIVDSDLRKPSQHQIFGKTDRGLTNILVEEAPLTEMIQATEVEHLDLLASGPIPPNPSELLGSSRMLAVIAQLKSQYDYLLFDAPPVLIVTDACVLASRLDGVILVTAAGMVKPESAKEAKELLLKSKGRLLGVVLNRAKIRNEHFYYQYYYS